MKQVLPGPPPDGSREIQAELNEVLRLQDLRTLGEIDRAKSEVSRDPIIFAEVFGLIASNGLQGKVVSFGGCFAFRPQRTGTKLSSHCWGIAVDLNSETNQQGTSGDMDAAVVEVFRGAGFEWGGDWPGIRRDAMHFQFCSDY